MAKCPRCGHGIPSDEHEGKYPGALCRRDNETEICSDCGTIEAIEDLTGYRFKGPVYWKYTPARQRL